MEAGKKLGVDPVLPAKDMADKNVEHLGVMAYAAHFEWLPEKPPLHDLIHLKLESTSGRIGEPVSWHWKHNILNNYNIHTIHNNVVRYKIVKNKTKSNLCWKFIFILRVTHWCKFAQVSL